MSLRVNTNIMALNTHRNLITNNTEQAKTMERLSSGLQINRGADGPAALVISERLRAQTAGLEQAIDNSETGVSLLQTAEAALDEVSSALINARQLAVHAANEAVNDDFMLRADQQEIDNILSTVNRIAQNTQYGTKRLLDGSRGASGVTSGASLEFVGATQATQSSGASGYDVFITQAARRSQVTGTVALTNEIIDAGEQITITEGSKTVNFQTIAGETVENNLNALRKAIQEADLNVELIRPEESVSEANAAQIMSIRHKEFGSEHTFSVSSSTAGLLSKEGNVYDTIQNGLDVQGELNGEEATGKGQILTGNAGNSNTEGLSIRYTGTSLPGLPEPSDLPQPLTQPPQTGAAPAAPAEGEAAAPAEGEAIVDNVYRPQLTQAQMGDLARVRAGSVTVTQNALVFQVGANAEQTTSIALRNMRTDSLGTGVQTDSGYQSLAQIDVTSAEKAQDSIRVLDRALEEVSSTRAEMGAFQKNNLESNLNYLRIAHENVTSSESVIRDADMAQEMTAFTRNQIMTDSATAMLAQANQRAQSVLRLIG
jgi:flagellin